MTHITRYQGAIIYDHHILLIKQTEHASGRSYWLIPGGRIEPDETEEICVQREMLEETCLHVQIHYLLLDEPNMPGRTYQRRKTYVCSIRMARHDQATNPEQSMQPHTALPRSVGLICGIPQLGTSRLYLIQSPTPCCNGYRLRLGTRSLT